MKRIFLWLAVAVVTLVFLVPATPGEGPAVQVVGHYTTTRGQSADDPLLVGRGWRSDLLLTESAIPERLGNFRVEARSENCPAGAPCFHYHHDTAERSALQVSLHDGLVGSLFHRASENSIDADELRVGDRLVFASSSLYPEDLETLCQGQALALPEGGATPRLVTPTLLDGDGLEFRDGITGFGRLVDMPAWHGAQKFIGQQTALLRIGTSWPESWPWADAGSLWLVADQVGAQQCLANVAAEALPACLSALGARPVQTALLPDSLGGAVSLQPDDPLSVGLPAVLFPPDGGDARAKRIRSAWNFVRLSEDGAESLSRIGSKKEPTPISSQGGLLFYRRLPNPSVWPLKYALLSVFRDGWDQPRVSPGLDVAEHLYLARCRAESVCTTRSWDGGCRPVGEAVLADGEWLVAGRGHYYQLTMEPGESRLFMDLSIPPDVATRTSFFFSLAQDRIGAKNGRTSVPWCGSGGLLLRGRRELESLAPGLEPVWSGGVLPQGQEVMELPLPRWATLPLADRPDITQDLAVLCIADDQLQLHALASGAGTDLWLPGGPQETIVSGDTFLVAGHRLRYTAHPIRAEALLASSGFALFISFFVVGAFVRLRQTLREVPGTDGGTVPLAACVVLAFLCMVAGVALQVRMAMNPDLLGSSDYLQRHLFTTFMAAIGLYFPIGLAAVIWRERKAQPDLPVLLMRPVWSFAAETVWLALLLLSTWMLLDRLAAPRLGPEGMALTEDHLGARTAAIAAGKWHVWFGIVAMLTVVSGIVALMLAWGRRIWDFAEEYLGLTTAFLADAFSWVDKRHQAVVACMVRKIRYLASDSLLPTMLRSAVMFLGVALVAVHFSSLVDWGRFDGTPLAELTALLVGAVVGIALLLTIFFAARYLWRRSEVWRVDIIDEYQAWAEQEQNPRWFRFCVLYLQETLRDEVFWEERSFMAWLGLGALFLLVGLTPGLSEGRALFGMDIKLAEFAPIPLGFGVAAMMTLFSTEEYGYRQIWRRVWAMSKRCGAWFGAVTALVLVGYGGSGDFGPLLVLVPALFTTAFAWALWDWMPAEHPEEKVFLERDIPRGLTLLVVLCVVAFLLFVGYQVATASFASDIPFVGKDLHRAVDRLDTYWNAWYTESGSWSTSALWIAGGLYDGEQHLSNLHSDLAFIAVIQSFGVSKALLVLGFYLVLALLLFLGGTQHLFWAGRGWNEGTTVDDSAVLLRRARAGYFLIFVGSYLLWEIFIHIGTCFLTVPQTGITLPWISSGGSAALAFALMVGIAMCVHVLASTRPQSPANAPLLKEDHHV